MLKSLRLLKIVVVAERVWLPDAPKFTVPEPATNRDPVPPHAVVLDLLTFNVLEPPFNVPLVRVITSEKLCVNPTPRFRVPPVPLIVNLAPFTLPANVAVPPDLVIEILPVVVKPAMLCDAIVPVIVIEDELAVNTPVPFFVKLPPNVKLLLLEPSVLSEAPLLIVKGTLVLKTLSLFSFISPVPAIITPPVAANVLSHSDPEVRDEVVLY